MAWKNLLSWLPWKRPSSHVIVSTRVVESASNEPGTTNRESSASSDWKRPK